MKSHANCVHQMLRAIGIVLFAIAAQAFAAPDISLAALQQGGHVLVMRHAQTVPGIGDPPNFKIGDCSTQRNLSDAGRDAARALGVQLQKANVKFDMVETSAWCRCVDTAKLVFNTAPQVYAPLNSTFNDRSTQPNRTEDIRKRVQQWRGAGNLALVTHMVNIQSLTGEVLAMNEVIVLKPSPTEASGFKIIGRLTQ
jgi:phosphohistidine phosphatase SixA